jgi:hypothetical protein
VAYSGVDLVVFSAQIITLDLTFSLLAQKSKDQLLGLDGHPIILV